jgi:hypothetical protein
MKNIPTMLASSILLVFGTSLVGVLQAQTVPSPEPPIHSVDPQQDQSQVPMKRQHQLIRQPNTQTPPNQSQRRHYRMITQQDQSTTHKQASSHAVTACNKVATKALESLKGGNLNAARSQLGNKLRHRTNIQLLQQRWKALTAEYGDVQNIGHADKGQEVRNLTAIMVPVKFQKGKIDARAMCNSQGRLASLDLGGMPGSGMSGQR